MQSVLSICFRTHVLFFRQKKKALTLRILSEHFGAYIFFRKTLALFLAAAVLSSNFVLTHLFSLSAGGCEGFLQEIQAQNVWCGGPVLSDGFSGGRSLFTLSAAGGWSARHLSLHQLKGKQQMQTYRGIIQIDGCQ